MLISQWNQENIYFNKDQQMYQFDKLIWLLFKFKAIYLYIKLWLQFSSDLK